MDLSLPIEAHGIIGNLHSAALIGTSGCIDWCCLPHFDSPPIFGAILDADKGGYFSLCPTIKFQTKQHYLAETNVLCTSFETKNGRADLVDYMPISEAPKKQVHQIIRKINCLEGTISFCVECKPVLNYKNSNLCIDYVEGNQITYSGGSDIKFTLTLPETCNFNPDSGIGTLTLSEGDELSFAFSYETDSDRETSTDIEDSFNQTCNYWHNWIKQISYDGQWKEAVQRSALTLKLLTFLPTGATVAAATSSLPETLGADRNWDYRYSWVRDSSFSIQTLMRIGCKEEGRAFIHWVLERLINSQSENLESPLQVMYTILGEEVPQEVNQPELSGYANSRPVRFGNAAAKQLQLDIYGEVLDCIHYFHKHVEPISIQLWNQVQRLADWVCLNWNQKDEGIWEVRSGRQDFVFSRIMCWSALDRSLRIAKSFSLSEKNEQNWVEVKEEIFQEIMDRGWCEQTKAFVQHYNSTELDSSILFMPMLGIVSATDKKFLSTIDAIQRQLTVNRLVLRYDPMKSPDGFESEEGSFTMCSFWLVECLSMAGRAEEARLLFEYLLTLRNHLGLYAEQIGKNAEALGNFPQAFTHFALINAALAIDSHH